MGDVDLARARTLCERMQWLDATQALLAADAAGLEVEDVERLAIAAQMTGDTDLACRSWERAHVAWRDRGDVPRAVRAATWLGMLLALRGRMAPAQGWFGRAGQLLAEAGIECAETGRVLVPQGLAALHRDPARALELFEEVVRLARAYDDDEVAVLGLLGTGQAHLRLGDPASGCPRLDEAMVLATSGRDVSPVAVGIVYCAVILECQRILDLRRAQEWTRELDRWSADQQGIAPFRGQCLVHRSEMAQLRGDWDAAEQEADDACRHTADPAGDPVLGLAMYQRAELHRLRGELDDAEAAYDQAVAHGHRDTPGRQRLLWQRGELPAAAASIRRVVEEEQGPLQRARDLDAMVDILLAAGDVAGARTGADGLRDLADLVGTPMMEAVAIRATAAVDLAEGRVDDAVAGARRAVAAWQELGVPYEVARSNEVLAAACAVRGDQPGADAARRAALHVFRELGAHVDAARLEGGDGDPGGEVPGGLSPREREVLVLLAEGDTNRGIAEALVISERTVERHVSNIFVKLGVHTRTAAASWAWDHGLAPGG